MTDDYRRQAGNVFFTLFGAVGLVGLLGVTAMTTMKGPVSSMHNVTQRTIAENNMIAAGKLALIAAASQDDDGDCDADTAIEPIPFSTSGEGPFPIGGGYLPDAIGAAKEDPWGNTYGYCAWDHGTVIKNGTCSDDSGRLRGKADHNGMALALISSGPDRIFQTSCANDPDYVIRNEGSDDVVLAYTYQEASALSAGLWNLKGGDPETAEIAKSLEVKDSSGNTTFSLDSFSGVGDFVGIVTGTIASKTPEDTVDISGGLKIDTEENVTTCTVSEIGTIRYHSANGLEVCDGVNWLPAGGSVIPTGAIAAFAMNSCPDGWSEYTPARGRFLRGIDPTGANDPDGVRTAGSIQNDANRSHGHDGTAASAGAHSHSINPPPVNTNSAGSHSHTMDNVGNNTSDVKTDNGGLSPSVRYNHDGTTNAAGAHTHSVNIPAFDSASVGAHTHSLTIDNNGGPEARPKNVAIMYCQYEGGVSTAVNGVGDLGDVAINNPQVGQILVYDGDHWVNTEPPEPADSVPSGAVMPFDLDACPSGWSPMASADGRFIVGAGSSYTRGDMGGEESVTLTEAQLPAHSHTGTTSVDGEHTHKMRRDISGGTKRDVFVFRDEYMGNGSGLSTDPAGGHAHTLNIDDTGGNQAHENRPPYLALLYCRKN